MTERIMFVPPSEQARTFPKTAGLSPGVLAYPQLEVGDHVILRGRKKGAGVITQARGRTQPVTVRLEGGAEQICDSLELLLTCHKRAAVTIRRPSGSWAIGVDRIGRDPPV